MCNGKKDDADKAGLFLPETNSHPASNIPRSAFCPLNGASIGPSLATLPFSAAAAILYVVCSISYFHLSCKIRLLHIGSKKKKVVHFCTTFKTNLQIIKKWVGPYRTHPWSEWNYRIPRNYEQQKWYSGSRQSVFPPILNREHLRRPIGQGAAFFFSQLRDKLSQSSAIGRRWELSLVLLALDFFF